MKTNSEFVILVDKNDLEIGVEEKIKAHKDGKLHRAFSILLFNDKKELLLQRRSPLKYHSAKLWTNACCSHPRPEEDNLSAAARRLNEELMISQDQPVQLTKLVDFIYFTEFENGLIEHEFDHVFIGYYAYTPDINPNEAMDYRWCSIEKIKENIKKSPNEFSFWFKEIISQFCKKIEKHIDESLQKRNI